MFFTILLAAEQHSENLADPNCAICSPPPPSQYLYRPPPPPLPIYQASPPLPVPVIPPSSPPPPPSLPPLLPSKTCNVGLGPCSMQCNDECCNAKCAEKFPGPLEGHGSCQNVGPPIYHGCLCTFKC